MNVERLKQTVDFLIQREEQHKIQHRLTSFLQAVNQLVSQPQQPQFQTQTAAAFEELRKAITDLFGSLTPAQVENIKAIGAYEYFSPSMMEEPQRLLAQSGITPAVLQQKVNELQARRDSYLEVLRTVADRLSKLGIGSAPLNPGDTELGVRLPAGLFNNEFAELVKKLSALSRILRFFAEAAGGNTSVEVRQISSTDPIFFLGVDATTAVEIGLTVTWLLNCLSKLFEIRKLRNEAARIGFAETDLKMFDERIKKTIEESIDQRVKQMIENFPQETKRPNLEQGLKWATETLVAWIDHGVTIELRSLRPPPTGDAVKDAAATERFAQLETLSQQLAFPPIEGPPVLQLPKEEPPQDSAQDKSETPHAEKEASLGKGRRPAKEN